MRNTPLILGAIAISAAIAVAPTPISPISDVAPGVTCESNANMSAHKYRVDHRPNSTVYWMFNQSDILPLSRVRTNDIGFRETQSLQTFSGDPFTVVVLGDSFTFGYALNTSQRYTNIVEKRLNANFDRDIEVINLALPGTGIKDNYYILKRVGRKFNPDLVVLAYHPQDELPRSLWPKIARTVAKEHNLSVVEMTKGDQHIAAKLAFWQRKKQYFNSLTWSRSGLRNYGNAAKKLAEEGGFSLIVYFFSKPASSAGGSSCQELSFCGPHERTVIGAWERRCGIKILYGPSNLTQHPDSYYRYPDSHFNAIGNKWLAQKLYPEISSRIQTKTS